MDAFSPARCGALLAAIATTGCMEVFGVEPPALPSAGASSVYDRRPPPVPAWPPSAEVRDARDVREVRGPAIVVLQVPAGSLVSVTFTPAGSLPPAPGPGSFRPSPYDEDPTPAPSRYKPSPYEDPHSLYRPD
jgi:hypothetical protein